MTNEEKVERYELALEAIINAIALCVPKDFSKGVDEVISNDNLSIGYDQVKCANAGINNILKAYRLPPIVSEVISEDSHYLIGIGEEDEAAAKEFTDAMNILFKK